MQEISTNQVRIRLGSIMSKIITGYFDDTYSMMASQVEKHAIEYHDTFSAQADTYIEIISGILDMPKQIHAITFITYPPIIFSVGLRYHLLSLLLESQDQSDIMSIPNDDKDFLVYMLNKYPKA